MSKVKYDGKENNCVLCCSNNKCGITIDCDINGTRNIYVIGEDDSERQMT